MKSPFLPSCPLQSRRAMTIPELMVVLAILAALTGLGIGGYQQFISKAESVDTIAKLRNMHAGLHSYLNDQLTWPQEPDDDEADLSGDALWEWWKKELKPVGIREEDWYTTAHLRRLNREMKEAGGKAISMEEMKEALAFPSIIPISFPPGPTEPFRYRSQPWVFETGEYHGDEGVFTIMPDGSIHKMLTPGQMNSARGKAPDSGKK